MFRTEHDSRRGPRAALTVVALGVWMACQGGEGEAGATASGGAGDETGAVSVESVGESGVFGTVRLNPGTDSVTVKLELLGVDSGERYPVVLREGGCDQEGATVAELNTPVVATVGLGSSLTTLATDRMSAGRPYSIHVSMPDGSPAACAEVRKPAG